VSSVLRVDGLTVKYGDFTALSDVSIDVPKNSITAVLGANGAGKTTLLRAISGLHRARAGSITLDSRRIDNLPPHDISRLGVVQLPEARGVFPDMTVEENLALAALYHRRSWFVGRMREILDPVYEDFPMLSQKRSLPAWTLSGGQQQLLAVARSFLLEPTVLLADELSFGLAPITADIVFGRVTKTNTENGTTVLMVEQNVGRALEMASYVYVLRTGSVVYAGPAAQLLADKDELFSHMVGLRGGGCAGYRRLLQPASH
jgi:branched-chain amino acid transport system ATP-binding protein